MSSSPRYRPAVRDQLLDLGVRPREDTDPSLVRAFLNELYTYELRKLRRALVEEESRTGHKLRREYSSRVVALRRRYGVLSQPVESWIEI